MWIIRWDWDGIVGLCVTDCEGVDRLTEFIVNWCDWNVNNKVGLGWNCGFMSRFFCVSYWGLQQENRNSNHKQENTTENNLLVRKKNIKCRSVLIKCWRNCCSNIKLEGISVNVILLHELFWSFNYKSALIFRFRTLNQLCVAARGIALSLLEIVRWNFVWNIRFCLKMLMQMKIKSVFRSLISSCKFENNRRGISFAKAG
jgi:hypothetical protein